jgi:hypothetical protein
MGLGDQHSVLAALPLGKSLGTHCRGGWVGPGLFWMGVEKRKSLAPTLGFESQTLWLVASHCTGYAIVPL